MEVKPGKIGGRDRYIYGAEAKRGGLEVLKVARAGTVPHQAKIEAVDEGGKAKGGSKEEEAGEIRRGGKIWREKKTRKWAVFIDKKEGKRHFMYLKDRWVDDGRRALAAISRRGPEAVAQVGIKKIKKKGKKENVAREDELINEKKCGKTNLLNVSGSRFQVFLSFKVKQGNSQNPQAR